MAGHIPLPAELPAGRCQLAPLQLVPAPAVLTMIAPLEVSVPTPDVTVTAPPDTFLPIPPETATAPPWPAVALLVSQIDTARFPRGCKVRGFAHFFAVVNLARIFTDCSEHAGNRLQFLELSRLQSYFHTDYTENDTILHLIFESSIQPSI